MKIYAALLPLFTMAMIGYGGETNRVDLHQPTVPAQPANKTSVAAETKSTNSAPALFRTEKVYTGVLPDLKKRKTQFFRADPQSRGPEFHNVSINPTTGHAEGIIVFSIGF